VNISRNRSVQREDNVFALGRSTGERHAGALADLSWLAHIFAVVGLRLYFKDAGQHCTAWWGILGDFSLAQPRPMPSPSLRLLPGTALSLLIATSCRIKCKGFI
jgi:hypothetical protein